MPLDIDIFGQGIYSPRQAARLIGTTPQEILRWTRGSGPNDPLWNAYYQGLDDTVELSFADLIEVRVVKAFRKASVSLQAIRFAIDFAQRKFDVERPLVTLEFRTDGTEILFKALEEDGDYVSLSKNRPGQRAFAEIIEQSLFDLEYDDGTAARWRPSNHAEVVIDPQRQFGQPLVDKCGLSTAIIFQEFLEFEDIEYLSQVYEVPSAVVRAAIRFEQSLETANGQSTV
ncbi:MAG: hypothetical protein JKY00_08685 [Roseicyclus sp.]|nr:hypothetical protein [Roseicyclus sp.]